MGVQGRTGQPDPDPKAAMPEEFQLDSATNLAVIVSWVAGAVTVAYFLGIAVSWVLQRAGRRSQWLTDIALLTRGPVRTGLVVIAASVALQRTSHPRTAGGPGWTTACGY